MTQTSESAERVYIILLNWNGWKDTISCLESLLRSSHPDCRVVVCDNDSQDRSVERIVAWARGEVIADAVPDETLQRLVQPAVPKPVSHALYFRQEAEAGGASKQSPRLTIVRTGGNLGYAGGMNVGLRYAMARGDCDYAWIVNNDLLVHPDAVPELLRTMKARPEAGMCGSTILEYGKPDVVQYAGGARYNRWLGTFRPIGQGLRRGELPDAGWVEKQLDYIAGSAMFVRRAWLEQVGLMNEDYFLYYEELDWKARAGKRFQLAYAPNSLVYHKGSATIERERKPASTDCLALRNRLLFTRRHHPWALPTVWLGFFVVLFNRLRRGQRDRLKPILNIMIGRWARVG